MKSLVTPVAVVLATGAIACPAVAAPAPAPMYRPPTQSAIRFAHVADRMPLPLFACPRRPAPLLGATSGHGDVTKASLAGGGALAAVVGLGWAGLRRRRAQGAL
jgi:hypothetical protein